MKKLILSFLFLLTSVFFFIPAVSADFEFTDLRFQGSFTTENLDKIIEEYELFDGWYWTTRPYIVQTFHGVEDAPGWTDTAVNGYGRSYYTPGMYGCRWECTMVLPEYRRAGRGECFGFASFIGYLLSGEYNPHGHWIRYYSLDASDGVRFGDIVRTEFEAKGIHYQHSAVVYSVSESGDDIRFLQISGSRYNLIILDEGFSDGYHLPLRSLEDLKKLPNIRICRSQMNTDEN